MATQSSRRVPKAYAGASTAAPKGVAGGQHVADPPTDDIVLFLIGMRINRWRKLRSWWPTFRAMPRTLAELDAADLGLLDVRTYWSGRTFMTIQYWRSAEELGAYARNPRRTHAPAWAKFNKRAAATGDLGIWHETYIVPGERIETLYGNMPPFGLAAAHGWTDRATTPARSQAHARLRTTEPELVDESVRGRRR